MKKYYLLLFSLLLHLYSNAAVYSPAQKNAFPDTSCIRIMPAFSPNGDGKDDVWLIGDLDCISVAAVKIYNRWGQLVYESEQYKNDWNGTDKQKPLPTGAYFYILNVQLTDNTRKELKGAVSILR